MGTHDRCTRSRLKAATYAVCFHVAFLCMSYSQTYESGVKQYVDMLEKFKHGERFEGHVDSLLVDGKPAPEGVQLMAGELRANRNQEVRGQIADCLITLGTKSDPLWRSGAAVVRNDHIVDGLVSGGISPLEGGADKILDALWGYVPAEKLQKHADVLVDYLRRNPGKEIFRVIAKAKPDNARPVVDELSRSRDWTSYEDFRVMQAALGEGNVEDAFIDEFLSTLDPQRKQQLSLLLGIIGTRKTGAALASQVRTPLIEELTMVYLRSVRLDVIAGLGIIHPLEPSLFEGAVMDDEGYDKVEQFCEREYHTQWQEQRPQFLAMQGLPFPPACGTTSQQDEFLEIRYSSYSSSTQVPESSSDEVTVANSGLMTVSVSGQTRKNPSGEWGIWSYRGSSSTQLTATEVRALQEEAKSLFHNWKEPDTMSTGEDPPDASFGSTLIIEYPSRSIRITEHLGGKTPGDPWLLARMMGEYKRKYQLDDKALANRKYRKW